MADDDNDNDDNKSNSDDSEFSSAFLIKSYLGVKQAAYAIVAFPIGTVLSIGQLFLYEEKGISIINTGFFMAAGEFLGICAMKTAELSKDGFVFKRPYDLHFINGSIAFALVMMPVWPVNLAYMSAFSMMIVQTFNSASKPVVGESMHRLAVFSEKEPSKVFAKANMFRRIGNGTVGMATPLLYAEVGPKVPFFIVGGIMIVFLGMCMYVDYKIKKLFEASLEIEAAMDLADSGGMDNDNVNNNSNASMRTKYARKPKYGTKQQSSISLLKSMRRRSKAKLVIKEDVDETEATLDTSANLMNLVIEEDHDEVDEEEAKFGNSVGLMNLVIEEDHDEDDEDGDEEGGQNFDESLVLTDLTEKETREETDDKNKKPLFIVDGNESNAAAAANDDDESNNNKNKKPKTWGTQYAYFLIVYAFPFWDAAVSRLPFAFLTVAIAQEFDILLASLVIFAYQMGRAIAQCIQVWKCNTTINYILNGVTFFAYLAFITYIKVVPDGKLWYIPFVFAGFAETLPIQQLYLLGLFGDAEEDDMSLRHAVKASHTGTGVGSMAAFLSASQTYSRFGISGIAYLGMSIMILKVATNLQIDYLHYRSNHKKNDDYDDDDSPTQAGNNKKNDDDYQTPGGDGVRSRPTLRKTKEWQSEIFQSSMLMMD